MLRQQLLRRISQLQSTALPTGLPRGKARGSRRRVLSPQHLDRGCEVSTSRGPCWIVQRPVQDVWRKASAWLETVDENIQVIHGGANPNPLGDLYELFPQRTILLDLETCGFAGSAVFLAGLICDCDGQLTLLQLFARDYSEEAALFSELWRIVRQAEVLVTFNGKSFDWPVVMDRSILHHLQDCHWRSRGPFDTDDWLADLRPPLHIDLLHLSRRLWKQRLPNCRLQTLESSICHRQRSGDIPGREIPDAYRDYVQHRDEQRINDVLHHNALDLVTLLQLLLVAIRITAKEERSAER